MPMALWQILKTLNRADTPRWLRVAALFSVVFLGGATGVWAARSQTITLVTPTTVVYGSGALSIKAVAVSAKPAPSWSA